MIAAPLEFIAFDFEIELNYRQIYKRAKRTKKQKLSDAASSLLCDSHF
jgi:hypothetical protein